MLLTPWLCASLVLILPTHISLLLRHSFQTINSVWMKKGSYDWAFVRLVLDLILSIFVEPFMYYLLHCHAFVHHASLHMHCFDCFCIGSYFYAFVFMCVKIQKPHKKWKIHKVWLYMFEHISHVSLALYFRTNGFMHLRA